jgi:NADH:ubiquinone oxidoreductase subunit C
MKELVHDTLGFHPERIEKLASGGVRVRIPHDRFSQVVVHWLGTAVSERPRLKALMPAAGESARLLLDYILEIPGSPTLLCLEVDVPRDRTLPSVTAVWPYAEWWQEELSVFNGARFEGAKQREESPWQQA